ncbi:MAG: D-aminoacyl-tRNA deacylase [Thermoplasmata archaeon]|nr:D-aminoacyl-tRNA deacylase [Thermoplasmata archaeon]
MRVLVCNRSDTASVNLRDRVLEGGDWEATNRRFRGAVVWSQSEALLVEVEGPTITDERLDADLRALDLPLRDVWFLSRHAAASGQPSLTAHPIGNPGPAKYGGQAETFSPAAARDMGALLRRMKLHAAEAGLPHQVTYEGTHHGPLMTLPSLFVEIGSDAKWYSDTASARVVAQAIQDVLRGEGRCPGPVLVGVGGGHYHPRHTDLALAGEADFGHLLPSHSLHGPETLRKAWLATPAAQGVYLHRKGMKGPEREQALAWCADLGLPIWESGTGAKPASSGAQVSEPP